MYVNSWVWWSCFTLCFSDWFTCTQHCECTYWHLSDSSFSPKAGQPDIISLLMDLRNSIRWDLEVKRLETPYSCILCCFIIVYDACYECSFTCKQRHLYYTQYNVFVDLFVCFSTCAGSCEQAVLSVSVWVGMAASAVGGNHLHTTWTHTVIIVTTLLLLRAPSGISPFYPHKKN